MPSTSSLDAELRKFNNTLQHFSKKLVREKQLVLMRAVSLQVLTGVVFKTPVDSGRARGGWQLDLGDFGDLPIDRLDPNGQASVADALNKLKRLRFGERIAIGNNVHYIRYLEDGSSKQAPEGMLQLTLAEVRAQFK